MVVQTVYFSPEIDKYFAAWILPATWHTSHWCDEGRFFQFAKALHYYGWSFDEALLRENIINAVEANHSFHRPTAEEIAAKRTREASLIYYFLRATEEFPVPGMDTWDSPLE